MHRRFVRQVPHSYRSPVGYIYPQMERYIPVRIAASLDLAFCCSGVNENITAVTKGDNKELGISVVVWITAVEEE